MTTGKVIARKCGFIGAGAGLMLYVLFGLLQGAVFGGMAGVMLANRLFGAGTIALMGNELITRAMVGGAMFAGALVSLVMFVVGGSVIGYMAGRLLGLVAVGTEPEEADAEGGEAVVGSRI